MGTVELLVLISHRNACECISSYLRKSSETCTKDHPKFILKKATLCYYIQHFSCISPSWTWWSYRSSKKVQRYDDGDAPEVQRTQPVVHAEVHVSVSSPALEKHSETCTKDHPKLIPKKATLCYSIFPVLFSHRHGGVKKFKLNSQDTPKISKHFH